MASGVQLGGLGLAGAIVTLGTAWQFVGQPILEWKGYVDDALAATLAHKDDYYITWAAQIAEQKALAFCRLNPHRCTVTE